MFDHNETLDEARARNIRDALFEDIGISDWTARLVPAGRRVQAHVRVREAAVLCGRDWFEGVFLALDGWIESRRPRWLLLGAFAVAMQIFAGHPQTVYVTGLAVGLYCLLRKEVVGVTAIYLGGAALGAVQLLAGFEATAETMRDRPLTRELAAYFSFPPESAAGIQTRRFSPATIIFTASPQPGIIFGTARRSDRGAGTSWTRVPSGFHTV